MSANSVARTCNERRRPSCGQDTGLGTESPSRAAEQLSARPHSSERGLIHKPLDQQQHGDSDRAKHSDEGEGRGDVGQAVASMSA